MKTIANIFFTLSALVFMAGFAVILFLRIVGPSYIASLDRAGAINEEVIKRDFPEHSQNLRHSLGRDITSLHERALWFFVSLGLVGSIAGFCCTFEKNKKEPEIENEA